MKKATNLFIILSVFLISAVSFAQQKKVYNPTEVEPGYVYVKFKEGVRERVTNPLGRSSLLKTPSLKNIDVKAIEPMVNDKALEKLYRKKARQNYHIDISSYGTIEFSKDIEINDAINELEASGLFEIVEPSFIRYLSYTPNDEDLVQQNYLPVIKALEAWDLTLASSEVVIGIVDSGVDINHPDLKDAIYINPDEIPDNGLDDDGDGFTDNVIGWDFVGENHQNLVMDNNPNESADDMSFSHGTAVAGCAVGIGDNSVGIAGVGFNAKFIPTKHHPSSDPSSLTIYRSLNGILYQGLQGVDIINASFGGPGFSQIAQDLYSFVINDQDVLIVAAAGNDGAYGPQYPCSYEGVLSVSATEVDDDRASFSNYDETVDIAAPGVGIYTTEIGQSYTVTQGTSFSSPIVAGAAALVKTKYPELSGVALGEVLRVTSDRNELYAANPLTTYRDRLGYGRLNVLRAITVQSPSIRVVDFSLTNDAGQIAQAGDQANFVADLVNYLWPSSENLTIQLSTTNINIEVLNGTTVVGSIGQGETFSNSSSPFRLRVKQQTPLNTTIRFKLTITDGEYTDVQYFDALVNPSYLNSNQNTVVATIAANGRIGYQGDSQSEGDGFIIDGRNVLYEMGLILTANDDKISNSVRGTGSTNDNDFRTLGNIAQNVPGERANSEIFGRFNDDLAALSKVGVEVSYRALAWTEEPFSKFIMLEYEIENTTEAALDSLYLGIFADWDISENFVNDRADWDESRSLGYVYNLDTEVMDAAYAGIQILSEGVNYFAIDNGGEAPENPLVMSDGFSDEEKIQAVSGGVARTQAGVYDEDGNDVIHVGAAGPYNIGVGETIKVVFAIHGATSLADLQASADAAILMQETILNIPQPTVTDAEVCYGDAATFTASGADNIKWYSSFSGGEPIAEGSEFTTDPLFIGSQYYVANADGEFESIRKLVSANVFASPNLTFSGALSFCEGEQVQVFAQPGNEYLWSTGETTQSITISESGDYFVVVAKPSIGCNVQSETFTIEVADSPVASFEYVFDDVDGSGELSKGDVVSFQDRSTGATSWLWEFGDGASSTDQNPTHIYQATNTFNAKLTVANDSNCADEFSESISVVTSVDELLRSTVQFYPNPTRSVLKIEVGNDLKGSVGISVSDLAGNQIQEVTLEKNGFEFDYTLDLENYRSGFYIVQFRINERSTFFKVVKN